MVLISRGDAMFARSGHTRDTVSAREVKDGPALGVHDFISSSFVDGHGKKCETIGGRCLGFYRLELLEECSTSRHI